MEEEAVITRQALGRIAELGGLYDAHKDAFCGHSAFFENVDKYLKSTDTQKMQIEYNFEDTLNAKLSKFNVEAELKGSFLVGLVKVEAGGHGQYLTSSASNEKEASASLICRMLTKHESINISDQSLINILSFDAIKNSPNATHIVTAIQWGAGATAELIYKFQSDESQQEIKGSLRAAFKKIVCAVKAKGNLEYNDESSNEYENFQLKFYVDALPNGESIPQTVEEVKEFMKKIPALIEKANGGKGVPLIYTLTHINSLKSYFKKMDFFDRIIHRIDENIIEEIVQIFDEISANLKKINNIYTEFCEQSYCLKEEIILKVGEKIKSIKSIQNGLRNDLYHGIIEVRYGRKNISLLTELIQSHQKSDVIPSIMSYCDSALLSCKEKIMYAKCLKNNKIIYVGRGTSLEAERLKNNSKEFYAFFCNWSNMENRTENSNIFIDLEDVKIFVDTEVNPLAQKCVPEGNRICHYFNGQYIDTDYLKTWKEEASKCFAKSNMQRQSVKKEPKNLTEVSLRCPLSYKRNQCDKSEHQWHCYECDEILQYDCNKNFYCQCGIANFEEFEYRCSDVKHGKSFDKFEDQKLQIILEKYRQNIVSSTTDVKQVSQDHFSKIFPMMIKQEKDGTANVSSWIQHRSYKKIYPENGNSLIEFCPVMVLKPTVNEIKAKCFEFTYNSVTDKYCRKYDDGSSSKGFESFTVSQNIMRKIEKDWKKAYLCRNKGCEKGEITWKIYFNGLKPKSIMIICEEPYKIKGGNISGSYYFNAEYLELHMEFMGGTGSNAYQYAQLFRCDLSNTRPNLLIHIEFE